MKYENLIGKQYNAWTVIGDAQRSGSDGHYWICQCECGTIKEVSGNSLKRERSKSCGCWKKAKLSNRVDLTGQKFDRLTVLRKNEELKEYGNTYWTCQCECGNICNKTTTYLHRTNFFHSCGCYQKEQIANLGKKDLLNQTFGKLTVIEELPERSNQGNIIWLCRCECGNLIKVPTNSLTTGNTSSCGCINYSIGEKNIENILKNEQINFISQYTESSLKRKRFDFAILSNENKLLRLIEFDGKQHYKDISGVWNSTETLEAIQIRDQDKNLWAKEHNIPLVRIPYWERDKITLDMIMGDQYLVH